MKPFLLLFSLLLFAGCSNDTPSALATMQGFYHEYLDDADTEPLPFSQAFARVQNENEQVCERHATPGPCGWGNGYDPFLGTSQRDPGLNETNAGIQYALTAPGEITVSLYPNPSNPVQHTQTRIVYRLILEDGQWVIDDLRNDGQLWARELMQQENERLSLPNDAI